MVPVVCTRGRLSWVLYVPPACRRPGCTLAINRAAAQLLAQRN
jgi:hypothetical protein